jgi:hypothetical protein
MFQRSRYLTLLQPLRTGGQDPAVVEALGVLDAALQTSPQVVHEVCALARDLNWRPNLVAAAAVARARMSTGVVVRELWAAIDRPSWVSPQLAVAASIVDPRFADGARARIGRATGKTLAALAALAEISMPPMDDPDHGADVAASWRRAMLVQYAAT